MPVFGLVVQMDDAAQATRRRVEAGLARQEGLELGACSGHRWPVVLESGTPEQAEARVEALRDVPGVVGVDVVYADFDDLLDQPLEDRVVHPRKGAARRGANEEA